MAEAWEASARNITAWAKASPRAAAQDNTPKKQLPPFHSEWRGRLGWGGTQDGQLTKSRPGLPPALPCCPGLTTPTNFHMQLAIAAFLVFLCASVSVVKNAPFSSLPAFLIQPVYF